MIRTHARQTQGEDLRPVWRNTPLAGGALDQQLRGIDTDQLAGNNFTHVWSVLRSAVLENELDAKGRMKLRMFIANWDEPLSQRGKLNMLHTSVLRDLSYEVSLTDPVTARSYQGEDVTKALTGAEARLPGHLFSKYPLNAKGSVAPVYKISIKVLYKGNLAGFFDFHLHQTWVPYSRFSITGKPLFGNNSPRKALACEYPSCSCRQPIAHA